METPERLLSRRIDYVKVIISGTPSEVFSTTSRYENVLQPFGVKVHGKANGKPYKLYPTHGSNPQTWYKAFECWGEGADALARSLKAHEWANVTRVDWREEIPPPPLSLAELEKRAHLACQGGIRITRDVSRLRSRRDGRDGGGQLLGVGSHKSDSRLTVYVRGTAEWATEAQLSGKTTQQLIAQALHAHGIEPFPPVYDALVPILRAKLGALILQRLAMPIEVLRGGERLSPQEELTNLFDTEPTYHRKDLNNILTECGPEAVVDWINLWFEDTGYRVILEEPGKTFGRQIPDDERE